MQSSLDFILLIKSRIWSDSSSLVSIKSVKSLFEKSSLILRYFIIFMFSCLKYSSSDSREDLHCSRSLIFSLAFKCSWFIFVKSWRVFPTYFWPFAIISVTLAVLKGIGGGGFCWYPWFPCPWLKKPWFFWLLKPWFWFGHWFPH